jgi:hypothetical protein
MNVKFLLCVLVLFSLLASCNMPASQTPVTQPPENQPISSDPNAIATAVELTSAAWLTQMAGSATPTSTPLPADTLAPTQCNPLVTATVNANVRSGPDTAYDIVGALTLGQTATIVGRNDAYSWWYIDFPAAGGGHAWVAGSVVSSACVPAVVQVVAAPPLPTATVTATSEPLADIPDLVLPLFELTIPDLTIVNMDVPTSIMAGNSVTVKVRVKNQGSGDAGSFTVHWWVDSELDCTWSVDALAAGASKTLTCSYNFPNSGNHIAKSMVDAVGTVNEGNESNNISQESVQVLMRLTIDPIFPLPQP